ncbi:Leucine-rich repeat-containing G-protein coupled receptor 5 [Holothuria leucospilota]|uniref:Leucine-rich repeat-containing G-protein coupled receptor 5 n=1 Tax=Holothuria leucospilota TaxID=206669 RepID=A0A9Q1CMY7_HOLLE|nr:Leucine-rich repeat-containing G-protein coupled receptor 5 [Holothuria leucospilota]
MPLSVAILFIFGLVCATKNASKPGQDACTTGVCICHETKKTFVVNCSNKNLQIVPNNIPQVVTIIYLANNNLTSLPNNTFVNMIKLTIIDLTSNNLQSIPSDLFGCLPLLNTVYLQQNRIKKIPEDIFFNNSQLWKVDLSFNEISEIPPQLFKTCKMLHVLQLFSNQIKEIPKGVFNSTQNLKYLTVSNNTIQELSKDVFSGLTLLTYFSIARNNISSLPADLFDDVSLSGSVDFSNNSIEEIPSGLFSGREHHLKMLYFQRNNLKFLRNDSFRGLRNLHHIFLQNNNIRYLEDGVFVGQNIRYIYIFGNELQQISNISFTEGTKEIHLYRNNIETLTTEALAPLGSNVTIFLTCGKLKCTPWSQNHINITCVNDHFVPKIIFNGTSPKNKLKLEKDGFHCTISGNRTECSPCKAGTFGDQRGSCLRCPAGGFYQDEIGLTHCKLCKNGTFVKSGGGFSSAQCEVCPEGTNQTKEAGYRACFCKANFTRTNRSNGCFFCTEEGLNCSLDFKVLLPGYYWNWSFPHLNITQYSFFVRNLQVEQNFIPSNPNTSYTYLMPQVFKCARTANCPNEDSATRITGTCGHGYRGWLCSKCKAKFYSLLNACYPCPSTVRMVIESVCIVCLCILIYLIVIWQNKLSRRLDYDRSLIDKVSSRMKITLGFYQVAAEVLESFDDIRWTGPLRGLAEVLSLLRFSILRVIIRPHCFRSSWVIDAKLKFKIGLSFPLALITSMFLFYQLVKLCSKLKLGRKITDVSYLKSKLYCYVVLLLFITYPPTCEAVFSLYSKACETFQLYEGGSPNTTITLLRSDFDLECKDLRTYQILAYCATALYVIMFPCILLFLLRKYCRGHVLEERRKVNTTKLEIDNENTPLINNNKAKQHFLPIWLRFLCENYKPQFWYWEIIELARKVSQTMLVTLFGWENALTVLLTIALSVLYLTLHVKLSPMKSQFEQRLQVMFSLTAIFINILIVAVPIPATYGPAISTCLILINMIIIFIILGEGTFAFVRFLVHRYWHIRFAKEHERQ